MTNKKVNNTHIEVLFINGLENYLNGGREYESMPPVADTQANLNRTKSYVDSTLVNRNYSGNIGKFLILFKTLLNNFEKLDDQISVESLGDLSTTRSNFNMNRRRQESVSRKLATLQTNNNVNVKTPSQNRRNTEAKAIEPLSRKADKLNKENVRSMTPRQQEEALSSSKSFTRTVETKELPNYLSLEKNLGLQNKFVTEQSN